MIPMVDLQRQYKLLKTEVDAAIQGVLDNTQFILGPKVSLLEEEIASYHGISHAIGVANGTDALLLALRGCGVEEGDEVITTPFTFIATAEVIAALNAVPVFVDIVPGTFNIDPQKIEEKITDKTTAIVPVHLYGHPADMEPILSIGTKYDLKIIEDCAQAFGAEYRGQKVGTFGDCGCFSFFPSKNLACYGDGGMVIAQNDDIARTVRMLRNHGGSVKYHHELLGYNSRLDEIQAAIVAVKLRRIEEFNDSRRKNADMYRTYIVRDNIVLPSEEPDCKHVYHQFTIRTDRRDSIAQALKDHDIASAIYYPVPLHKQVVFANSGTETGELKISEQCSRDVLSLPMFPELTEMEIRQICEVVNHVS